MICARSMTQWSGPASESIADIRVTSAPGTIGIPSDASASRAELIERARVREAIGDELHATGMTEDARRHWDRAMHYRALAEGRA